MEARVVIQQLHVDVFIDGHAVPVDLLNDITRQLQTHVLPLLNSQLTDVQEGITRIERLALDVHTPESGSWQRDFVRQVADAINGSTLNSHPGKGNTSVSKRSVTDLSSNVQGNIRVVSFQEECTQLLSHFYLKGVLPWWKSSLGVQVYKEAEEHWMKIASGEHEAVLVQSLAGESKAIERLMRHASLPLKKRLLGHVIPEKWRSVFGKLPDSHPLHEFVLRKLLGTPVVQESSFALVVSRWCAVAGKNPFSSVPLTENETHFVHQLHKSLSEYVSRNPKESIAAIADGPLRELFLQQQTTFGKVIRELFRLTDQEEQSLTLTAIRSVLEDIHRAHSDPQLRDQAQRLLQLEPFTAIASPQPEIVPDNEPEYVSNAGLVLLNPFLPTLFQNRGLLDAQHQWLSDMHRAEALLLLHFLATGDWDPTEDQLTVAKLLTGFPLDEPVPEFVVTPKTSAQIAERDTCMHIETEGFLQAIHTNWRPMRNCTWEGLRNDFLKRSARIRRSGSHSMQYKLTVEPHTLDVLLPFKEWGHSMIKYSWMDEVLVVEWG